MHAWMRSDKREGFVLYLSNASFTCPLKQRLSYSCLNSETESPSLWAVLAELVEKKLLVGSCRVLSKEEKPR